MDLAQEYEEVFMNIEMNVVRHCEDHPDFVDHNIDKVYEGVQRTLEKELQGRKPPRLRWKDSEEDLYMLLMAISEALMGEPLETTEGETIELVDEPLEKELVVKIFKRLRSSVKTWTGKAYGRRGYIDYISKFM